jgi:polyisoprenoid-binding protein YceI
VAGSGYGVNPYHTSPQYLTCITTNIYNLKMIVERPIAFQKRTAMKRSLIFLIIAATCLCADAFSADSILPLAPADSWLHFTGSSFLHDFQGVAKEFDGSAVVNLSATPPVQTAHLEFKTAELTTFNQKRDDNMKKWMHVEIHPEAVFSLEKVRPIYGDYKTATLQHPAQFAVSGTFNLNGVKQRIVGNALGWREKDRLLVTGGLVLNTLDFKLPQIRLVLISVAPDVVISYRFCFKIPSELGLK